MSTGWHKKFPEVQLFEPPKSLEVLVKQGKLGVKSGEGFYKYNKWVYLDPDAIFYNIFIWNTSHLLNYLFSILNVFNIFIVYFTYET